MGSTCTCNYKFAAGMRQSLGVCAWAGGGLLKWGNRDCLLTWQWSRSHGLLEADSNEDGLWKNGRSPSAVWHQPSQWEIRRPVSA